MAINRLISPLLTDDGRLSASEVDKLGALAADGKINRKDVEALAGRYVDALDGGTAEKLAQVASKLGGRIQLSAPIANLEQARAVLDGAVVLGSDAHRRHPAVTTVQRGLMALANREQKPELMLPRYGADGDYGSETRNAVLAFQKSARLPMTGVTDQATARALDTRLRATQIPVLGGAPLSPGKALAAAARKLVTEHRDSYGVDQAWVNQDPNHALPTNVPLGGLKGTWKCNLFAGNAIYLAGYTPPYYGNRGGGEYPNANQLFKWSDAHAGKWNNPVHFQLGGEFDVEGVEKTAGADRAKRLLASVLHKAKAGDLLIVDHRGDEVADGGHCRVILENNMTERGEGRLVCAQASKASARVRDEPIDNFTGESKVWLLRPNKPRGDIA